MKTIVDASPLIFLGKLGRLPLLEKLLKGPFMTTELVREEVLSSSGSDADKERLLSALRGWKIVPLRPSSPRSARLSLQDTSLLELAERSGNVLIVTDDGGLRRFFDGAGRPVIGTLGVLARSARSGLLPARDARRSGEELIHRHGLRAAPDVYKKFLDSLPR